MSCKHTYEFQGVVYSFGHQLPGSGAHEVIYEDRYYCTQCLDVVDKNPRVKGNSYEKRIVGSFPK